MSNKEMGTEDALRYAQKAAAALEQERDALKKELAEKELLLAEKEDELRGLYVSACLKFGTWTSPMAMEMVLPLRNTEPSIVKTYALSLTDKVDKNERIVRVVKRGFGAC